VSEPCACLGSAGWRRRYFALRSQLLFSSCLSFARPFARFALVCALKAQLQIRGADLRSERAHSVERTLVSEREQLASLGCTSGFVVVSFVVSLTTNTTTHCNLLALLSDDHLTTRHNTTTTTTNPRRRRDQWNRSNSNTTTETVTNRPTQTIGNTNYPADTDP
jgi:hypothetical protein